MKKIPFLIAFMLFTTTAFAAPMQPQAPVWTVPSTPKQGERVELNALVFNNNTKTVTVAVLFATPADDIATINATLPAGTAKTVTSDWTVPNEQVIVTASVIKAVDAGQKVVPELLGPIGTVTVGVLPKKSFSLGSFTVSSKTWFGTLLGIVDPWRKQQAEKYTALRDTTRASLNIDEVADITERFNTPDTPGVPKEKTTATQQAFPIGKYATLLFASALVTIFASSTVFYIAVVLVILIFFRFFIRLFT